MKEALPVIDVQNEYFTGRLPVTRRAVLVTRQQRFSRVMTTDEWIREFLKNGKNTYPKSAPVNGSSENLN